MKKLFLVLVLSMFLISLVSAVDVAYIVKTSGNSNIVSVLNELSYTYDVIKETQIQETNFSNYAVLLIQDDVNNKNYIPFSSKNLIFLQKNIVPSVWSTALVGQSSALYAKFQELGTPFTEGFSEVDFRAYTLQDTIYYLKIKPSYVKKVVLKDGSTVAYPIVAYSEIDNRKVFFGFPEINYWTSDTKKLFKNSVKFVRQGTDFDGDGFYTDEDCNDNDASINPDAEEIPYDGKDNDCSGGDLRDVDEDGFDAEIVGGEDCNDNDASINPDAEEIFDSVDQNCKNDAPVFTGMINNIEWNEDTEAENVIDLSVYFKDYEADILNFGVYGTSENQKIILALNNSMASFISEENWNGEDWIIFKACDSGSCGESNNVTLRVLAVNDAPVLENIENVYVLEGRLVKIIPEASDVDNDILTFTFSSPLNSSGEWQTQIGDTGTYTSEVKVQDGKGGEDTENAIINVLPKLYINELVSDPLEGNDWIEIYNPKNSGVSLEECELKDKAGNKVKLSGNISGENFKVFEFSNKLNIDGDIINLICQNITVDSVAYGSEGELPAPEDGKSLGRVSDGSEEFIIFNYPTKGLSNLEDVASPQVSLISPEDSSFFDVSTITLRFNAIDDKAGELDCGLYYSINSGSFAERQRKEINAGTGEFSLLDIEDGIYSWNVKCSDGKNIGTAERNFEFTVDEPDAPVIQEILDIDVDEEDIAEIIVQASDADGDILTYSINDTRFTQQENLFRWQTSYIDAGVYYVAVYATDGSFTVGKEVKVIVREKNVPPFIQEIENITLAEDSGFFDNIDIVAWDVDGSINRIEISYENLNKVDCAVSNNKLGVTPAKDFFGEANCKIRVYDNQNAYSETQVNINILPVNDAPVIDSFSPSFNPLISEEGSQSFSIIKHDIDNLEAEVLVQWFVNNELKAIGNNFVFNAGGIGEYEIEARASDLENSASKIWNLKASNKPITEGYTGGTTDFTSMSEQELANVNLVLEKENGKIEFLEALDLRNTVDFVNYAGILNSLIGINTNYLTALKNKPAKVTFYNLNFQKMPSIYYTPLYTLNYNEVTSLCPLSVCQNMSYDSGTGTLSFLTSGFSSFKIGDVVSCSKQGGKICKTEEICQGTLLNAIESSCCSGTCAERPPAFSDVDERCENKTSILEIKEPDSGDDFKVWDKIYVEAELENTAEKNIKFDVKAYLYDITKDKVVEEDEDDIKINKDEKEKVSFEFEIDSDIDDSDKYAVFVYVEEHDKKLCDEDFVKINIEREEHDVIIKEMNELGISACSQYVDVAFDLENIGQEDEEVYVVLENAELGIFEKTSIFELEEGKETSVMISVKIPENAEAGKYDLNARVIFGKEEVQRKAGIVLDECIKEGYEIISEDIIRFGKKDLQIAERPEFKFPELKSQLTLLNILLVLGIVVIFFLIIIAASRRR